MTFLIIIATILALILTSPLDRRFEYHPTMFLITPAIAVTCGECSDPTCPASHWRLSISWLAWTFELWT